MPSPFPGIDPSDAVDSVAHIIQVALTPVFLLSGIGTLLNVFNTRLSRVSDHTEHTGELLACEEDAARHRELSRHMRRLRRRQLVLDASVLFAGLGGAATCAAAFALFLGGTRGSSVAFWLFGLFGMALVCTVLALSAFLVDSIMAWHGLRKDGPLPRAKA